MKKIYFVKREVIAESAEEAISKKGIVSEVWLAPADLQPKIQDEQNFIGFKKK